MLEYYFPNLGADFLFLGQQQKATTVYGLTENMKLPQIIEETFKEC